MAALYIIGRGGDPGGGVTARLIAGRKLCRVPAAGLSRSSWQRTRRQAWMRAVWRGGEGLDPAGGWRIDESAMSGLARHAGIHPEDPWCPLLLVRGSGSASTDRRLVECAWLTGPRHEGIAAVRKLALAVQQALATRCGLPPRETGVVALDPGSMVWSWSPAAVDLSRIEEISQSSEKFWNRHVMSGTLPDAPAETEQQILDDPELKEMLRECWAVALLRQAAEEAEKEKKTKLRELMRQRGAGRRARVEVKELCSLSLFPPDGKRLLVSALEQAGLDPARFRTGDDPVDGEAVMARLKEIAGAAEAGEDPLDRLNSLASAPPRRPGAIDPDAARSAIEQAGIAAEAALPPVMRIDSAATARAGRIREETRLRLDEVISDVVELVGGGKCAGTACRRTGDLSPEAVPACRTTLRRTLLPSRTDLTT